MGPRRGGIRGVLRVVRRPAVRARTGLWRRTVFVRRRMGQNGAIRCRRRSHLQVFRPGSEGRFRNHGRADARGNAKGARTVPVGPLWKSRTGPPAAPRHPEYLPLRFSISNPARSLRFGEPARVTLPIEVLRSCPLFASAVSVHRGIQPKYAPLLPQGTASGRERGPGIPIVRHGW